MITSKFAIRTTNKLCYCRKGLSCSFYKITKWKIPKY